MGLSFRYITVLSANGDTFTNSIPICISRICVFWHGIVAKYSVHKANIVEM